MSNVERMEKALKDAEDRWWDDDEVLDHPHKSLALAALACAREIAEEVPARMCDCECGSNGFGMVDRECDCMNSATEWNAYRTAVLAALTPKGK